jgi:DNA-binding MarR family transcriptional regulator
MLNELMSYKLAKVSNGLSVPTARMYFAEFGLKVLDWRIIVALRHEGPLTVLEAASLIQANKGNVSRSVAALEEAGVVKRTGDPVDQRKVKLELTRKGVALFDRINPIARAREKQLLAALSSRERDELASLLDRLIAQLQRMDGGGTI